MPGDSRPLGDILLDALDIGVIVIAADGLVTGWNGWMVSATNITAAAAIGRSLSDLFPNGALTRLNSAVRDALVSGSSSLLTHSLHRAPLSLSTRSGRVMTYDIAVRATGDKPDAYCMVQIVDVTLAAEREKVLRERQNARYDAVLESAADAIMTFDAEGRIQLVNPAGIREFGYAAAELLGRPIDGMLKDLTTWRAAWNAVVGGEVVHWPVELIVRRKDGSDCHVDASASLWRSESRVFVTAIFRDVNEQRAAEAALRRINETLEARVRERTADLERLHDQLRQSQKMEAIGQLTGGIAHDFNNLLTPIVGGLDILQRRGVADERGQRLIDGALQSAERARVLVQRLLAFARRQPLQPTAVDVKQIVVSMTDLISSTIGPSIRVRVDAPDDTPPAMADPNQLEMALLNLAVNARDAMPEGGVLTIGVRASHLAKAGRLSPGSYVRVAVSDTGVGMDPQTLERAVEPFFSTKGIGKGTGLGLSMIHGLMAQLGGGLDLASAVGVGTTVEMWIPVAPEGASHAAGKRSEMGAASGAGLVLLVDDEDLIRATTAQMLIDFGYAVVEARSAVEALDRVADADPTVVLTDHLMPGMTGAELAREIRARRPDLPVLIISGFAELEDIAPDLPRLMKPFRAADLAAALTAVS